MKKDFNKKHKIHFYAVCMLIVLSIVFCFNFINSPLFLRGDSLFHLNRIQGLSNYLTSPVNFTTFNHQGKGVNLFYPSQILYFVNIIYYFIRDYIISFKIFIFFLVTIGLLNMYYVLYKIKKNIFVSIAGALLFIFDNYFIGNIYERLAMGEVQAYVFMPIVIYGIYELFFRKYKKWYVLPIGLAFVAYSHLLSLMIISVFVIVGFIVSLVTQKYNLERFKYITLAFVVTILLIMVQVGPIIEQTSAYELYTTWDKTNIGSTSKDIWLLLWLSMNNDFFNFMFGISTLFLYIFGLFKIKKLSSFEKMLYFSAVILLLLQTKYLPWNLLEMTPIIKVQFLWRFNGFITLFLVVALVGHLFKKRNFYKFNLMLLLVIVTGMIYLQFSAVIHYYRTELPGGKERILFNDQELRKYTLNYSQMDYSNKLQYTSFDFNYNQSRPTFINDKVVKVNEKISENDFSTSFTSLTSKRQVVNLPITLYKGTNVKVNNKNVKPFVSKRGTLSFNIYQKGKVTVNVFNSWTLTSRLLQLIAIITWIVLIVYIVFHNY